MFTSRFIYLYVCVLFYIRLPFCIHFDADIISVFFFILHISYFEHILFVSSYEIAVYAASFHFFSILPSFGYNIHEWKMKKKWNSYSNRLTHTEYIYIYIHNFYEVLLPQKNRLNSFGRWMVNALTEHQPKKDRCIWTHTHIYILIFCTRAYFHEENYINVVSVLIIFYSVLDT